ncbi:hypothetical protein KEH56_18620 (plasmid) [Burkholderia cenocepacia]|jgi:hypothetical protein|uniref:hypothetical protein n=1 Tax=Burkholderia cepacia complex TaxID=87882 RepID=UPI001589A7BE|nr:MULTISPECIES: hypothetical protein [Burkholderia cepacia complex]MDN7926970.1 hypothetical protein [Burkholderia vietnamiensis]QUN41453.1 hypothetical protein KEH56_18620 [Burkholderia cenocepacia]QUO30766.1 hypothetical protein KEH57_36680 [Burkholderia cenocepacia]
MLETTRTDSARGDKQPRPRWTAIALFWLFIGCLSVAFAAATLLVAGMDGALGCMAYGIVAIVIARNARHWS